MKKIISTVAALGLVAGFAASASAMDFSMTGKYVLEGYMLNNADGAEKSNVSASTANGGFDPYSDEAGTDSAWVQTFLVKPTLKVNDKITMISEIRFAKDSDWGSQDDLMAYNHDSSSRDLDIYHIYMEYMSPVGKLRMGRTPAGSWGSDFLSTASTANRFMWWPSFVAEPFSLCIFTQKSTEGDWYDGDSDSDNDLYEIDLTYKVDNMNLRVAYDYFNYKGSSDIAGTVKTPASITYVDGTPDTISYTPAVNYTKDEQYDRQNHRLKANADMKFGDISVLGEWGWQFGKWMEYDTETVGVREDRDVDAMAAMLDVSYKMDKLDVGMMYFWAEGQDKRTSSTDDEDVTAAMAGTLDDGIGDDFNPYYILTGDHTGMLNSDEYNDDSNMATGGVSCIGLHTDFAVSDQLSLHGALAYAWADDTAEVERLSGINSVDDDYGWEVDLGAKYKLLDNLTYELRGAYFNTGDFFDDLNGTTTDVDDLYLVSHHLTMTF
ncbi:MAG: hypothetical protein V1706_14430 [Pseudomonadota bacterium]